MRHHNAACALFCTIVCANQKNMDICIPVTPYPNLMPMPKPDTRVKNIKELAALLGISVTTVSRVLNGKAKLYRISPATSEKVLNAARQFNYRPNSIARGLRLEKTDTLGLIIPDISNPYFSSIARTIELESRNQGYSIILCDSMDELQTEKELLKLLASRKVDGIILAPVGKSFAHIKEFSKSGVPVVIIDRYMPGGTIPFITTDNYAGSVDAMEHLISAGHTRIACIQGIQGISINTDRVNGYRDALAKHGITIDNGLITGNDFGIGNGYTCARMLMSMPKPPTAIFAFSNLIALGVMRALNEAHLRIPDDVSVVSFDDQPYFEFLASPMTTVEQPRAEIAGMAIKILLEIINSKSTASRTRIMLKPRLIIRASVGKPSDPLPEISSTIINPPKT
jgi:LacI family transcriptional regulator